MPSRNSHRMIAVAGRNFPDFRDRSESRQHSPDHFRLRQIEEEAVRFVGEIPSGGFPLTLEWEVYIPSSRIFLLYGWIFDEDDGQPDQRDGTYVYNALWGPANAEMRMEGGAFRWINEVIPALSPLPDSREVNSNAKRIRGNAQFLAAPTVLGVPIPGAWRFFAMAEPNQEFGGATEEWDRIANEIQLRVGNFDPASEGGRGSIGPGRGAGTAFLLTECAPLNFIPVFDPPNPAVQGVSGPPVAATGVTPVGPQCNVPAPPTTIATEFVQNIVNGHLSSDGVTADDLVQFGPKPASPDCEACDPLAAPLPSTALTTPVTLGDTVTATFVDVIPQDSIVKFWVYAEPAASPGAGCGRFFGPFCFGTDTPIA